METVYHLARQDRTSARQVLASESLSRDGAYGCARMARIGGEDDCRAGMGFGGEGGDGGGRGGSGGVGGLRHWRSTVRSRDAAR